MLFLCSFYLKQIFEDVELETRLQNVKKYIKVELFLL